MVFDPVATDHRWQGQGHLAVSVRGGDAVSIIALNPEQAVDEDVSEEPVENVEGDAAHSEPGDVLLQSDIVDGDRAVDTAESEMGPEDNGE